ncbi:protein ECT2 isoform X2 [Lutzomyia longipalpis]|uniref:protein ECT2 isoform X2 n=1 Tax=Lutzomyia longipalpis TaxID=7200 RepID=UPI0024842896|nr:protein ECT2 isoform X2 [Lutzomyia longipalpis]
MQLRVFRSEAEEEKFKNYTCLELTQKMPIARYHWGIIGPPHSELSTVAEVENRRICLVGTVLDDEGTVKAAQSFGIPVITSETGSEYILDHDWVTYFVVNQFDGPMFEAIHKSKHRILGPPALKQLFLAKDVLPSSNRPIYNYAMKGVITCFTGIRKKEELTHLVSLIHAMGGKIRKDMNSRITHLICNNSGGEKYQYAMTFRLTVVRSDWVLAAWERRNEMDFSANEEDFSRMHRTKAFEGQRICFFGFSPDEHQHMVDVLVANGGAPANIDDPECTHVVMSNTGDHFPEILNPSPELSVLEPPQKQCANTDGGGPLLTSSPVQEAKGVAEAVGTAAQVAQGDGEERFSPIAGRSEESFVGVVLQPINEEDDESTLKRKRDSFDNISMVSIDSLAPSVMSAKKPKLTRTGSISRTLKRSMSFMTPISSIFRPSGRTSVDPNASLTSITSIESSTLNESIRKPMREVFRGMKERITRASKKDFVQTPKSSKSGRLGRFGKKDDGAEDADETLDVANATLIEGEDEATCGGFKTPIAPSKSHPTVGRHSVCGTPTDYPTACRSDTNNARKSLIQASSSVPTSSILPIVDEHAVHSKLDVINSKTHILKADWFWYTIQNGFADETDYRFDDYLDSIANTPCSDRRDSLPVTFNKRKRKRLSRTIKEELTPLGLGKRRSSVSDAGLLSVSGSFLECTASPDKNDVSKPIPEAEVTPDVPVSTKKQSMRYNHFLDFYQTESNYVGILDTIVKLFKEPLEKMADSNPSDALLNKSEIRAIFSNFLPIHDVHWKMLNSIKELQVNWAEDCLIGKIILDHRDDLIKAYPPYVNFFEQMKDALILCDNQKPRFHAFLKINQAKPECGRQSLQDLMIRPVQRLPSISLLINDILKHTPKSNPDAKKLEEALRAIKEVMTYINEDKRKTDGQIAMFDIFNDIDNCPPDLVSAQRSLVSKCEVTELSDQLSGRGDSLMLCLFTDNIEVCKKRSRGFNQAKSPSTTMNGLNVTTKVKSYKHIKLIPLSSIRFVVDIRDSPRAFALSCRLSKENKDKEYYFSINEEEVDKTMYLRSLCKQLAENSCRADADQFLASVDSTELSIDISDLNIGTLSKAFKFATRTRLKVGRAFSFNKTPSKLKRAVSTMMTNSLTPASQLAQMKLASCNNINKKKVQKHGSIYDAFAL